MGESETEPGQLEFPHPTDAQMDLRSSSLLSSTPSDKIATNVSNMTHSHIIRPAGTRNTSPLTKNISVWHVELSAAHACYCNKKLQGDCPGPRPLEQIIGGTSLHLACPKAWKNMCLTSVEVELLTHDIFHGFPVIPANLAPSSVPDFVVENYPISPVCAAAVEEGLTKDLADGLLVEVAARPAHVTALHAKQEKDKVRTICDYSMPEGRSINDVSDARHFSMMSHEHAYALMQPYHYMAKVDIKSAFRTVGVLPEHWRLLGYQWKFKDGRTRFFHDTRFPFGLKCSPEIFCRISQAVRAMLAAKGCRATVVYVDDFWVIAPTEAECEQAKQMLLSLLQALGFTVSAHKVVGPLQKLDFCGLVLETNADGRGQMRVTVPPEKLVRAAEIAVAIQRTEVVSVHTLQQALGYFNHIATAVYAARAYLRRLITALTAAEAAHRKSVQLTRSMKLDLAFWAKYANGFNGHAVILQQPLMDTGFLATDACGDKGMGGFYNGRTFAVRWGEEGRARLPKAVRSRNLKKLWPNHTTELGAGHINYKELFAIWWALLKWHGHFVGRTVVLHCDNDTARCTFIKNDARSPSMMRLIRHMLRFCAEHQIRLRIVRVASAANKIADALSRYNRPAYLAARAEWQAGQHFRVAPEWQPREFVDPGFLLQKAAELKRV